MAKVYTFVANSSSITEAKFDRYVAKSNILKNLGHSAYENIRHQVKRAPEQTLSETTDRDTSKLVRPTIKAIAPVVLGSAATVVSQTYMYQGYLKNEAKAAEYAKNVNFESLTKDMEKVGLKVEHNTPFSSRASKLGFGPTAKQLDHGISVTSYDLDGAINHGTIVKDLNTNEYVALKDYSNLNVERVEGKYHNKDIFAIKNADGDTIATVSKKTLDKSFGNRLSFSEATGKGVIGGRGDYVDIRQTVENINNDLATGKAFKRTILHGDVTIDPISKTVEIKNDASSPIASTLRNALQKYTKEVSGTASALNNPATTTFKYGTNTNQKIIPGTKDGEFISKNLEFRRKTLHYHIDGNNLITHNLRGEAGASADMYKRFVHLAKKNQTEFIDPQNLKDAKVLAKYNKRLNKRMNGYTKLNKVASPMRLGKSWSRLILKESIKGSEGNSGLQLLDTLSHPAGTLGKSALKIVPNTAYNAVAYANRKMIAKKWLLENKDKELASGLSKRALNNKAIEFAKENAKLKHIKLRDLNKVNPLIRAYSDNIRYRVTMKYASTLLKSNNDVVKFFGNKAMIKEAMRNSHMGKDVAAAYKMANKQLLMAHSKTYRGYIERKAAKDAIKTARQSEKIATKMSKKATKNAAKATKAVTKAANRVAARSAREAERAAKEAARLAKRLKWVSSVSKKLGMSAKSTKAALTLTEKISKGLAAGAKAVGAAIISFLSDPVVLLIAVVLLLMMLGAGLLFGAGPMFALQAKDYNNEAARFESTDFERWTEYRQNIMNQLKDLHTEELEKIEEYLEEYDTADIQFPSGKQENYKEMFVAMEIMLQYGPDNIPADDLKDIASELYDRTHQITRVEYTYYDSAGNPHDACHIYMYIQRGDQLCYEAMADVHSTVQADEAKRGSNYIYCPETNVVDTNWLSIIRGIKQAIADSNCYYYNLNDKRTDNDSTINISVNGRRMTVRPDCSGFVSAALYVRGVLSNPTQYTSGQFAGLSRGTGSLPGFTVMDWCGWDNLAEGDIIARNGHVEVFAYNSGSSHYVYNCGSDHSVSVAGPTSAAYSSYSTVIRPGGETGREDLADAGEGNGNNEGGRGVAPERSNKDKLAFKMDYDGIVYDSNFSPDYVTLPYSNTDEVEFDEKTGNEAGYEDTLRADIEAEIDGELFTPANYIFGNEDHTLAPGSKASTSDFVRYILAKHGVKFEMDDGNAVWNGENTLLKDIKPGDIVWYMPKTAWSDHVATKKPWKQITSASNVPCVDGLKSAASEEKFYQNVVPCIYMGNGEIAAYSKDLSASNASNTGGKLRTYNLSSLDPANIIVITRLSGYTVDPIFGNTNSFEGWNDENITYFIEMAYDDCWETGKKELIFNEEEDWMKGIYRNYRDPYTIDYSWYEEDMFDGDQTYASEEHDQQYLNDTIVEFIKTYDKYGILPSFGYSYSSALTDGRTTEESLSYYNIFEMEDISRSENGYVDKYSYNEKGDASVSSTHYKVFDSYEDCIKAYYEWLLSERKDSSVITSYAYGDMSDSENGAHESFDDQLRAFNMNGLAREELDDLRKAYIEKQDILTDADRLAIDRKKTLMVINHYTREVRMIAEDPEAYYSDSGYSEMIAYRDILDNAVDHFEGMYRSRYCTDENNETLARAVEALNDLENAYQPEIALTAGDSHFGHASRYCEGDTKCNNLIVTDSGNVECGGHGYISYFDY